jgi:hypothetical protein
MQTLKTDNNRMAIMKRKTFIALVITSLLLAITSPVTAAGLANARATAMAGAYTSLAQGYYCPSFNPANLGLPANQMRGFQLFGAGVSIKNNSFSLDDYNSYTGAHLSESDKQDLLSKIPAEGLKVSADADASGIGVGLGNFVVSFSAMGAAEINLGRTAMELLLNGNAFADTLDLSDVYGEGYGLWALNFSYGRRLYKNADRQLSAGATFRYLKGLGYEEIVEANGEAVTLSSGFEGGGSLAARAATGGSGYALDLGAALQINQNYTVGATIFNFLSGISWNKDTEEHRYTFDFDTVTLANMSNDSLFTSTDTTFAIGSFTSHLPANIKVGLAKTSGKLLWAVDWEQGFKKAAGSSATPRVSTGGEYRLSSFLPLRAGFALGGKQGTTYAGGFGIDVSMFHLDLAVANYNAIAGSSGKGLNFAVNSGFRF